MVNLDWCCNQKNGISLIDPNDNLSGEYIRSAEETLSSLKDSNEDSNMWKATKKYYTEYLSIYALFMKLGIKCEIHDCAIELVKYLQDVFPKEFYDRLKEDKKLRIDNQYYLKNIDVDIDYDYLLEFILTMKEKISTLSPSEINDIRNKLKSELGL